jgi:hypothetical protein
VKDLTAIHEGAHAVLCSLRDVPFSIAWLRHRPGKDGARGQTLWKPGRASDLAMLEILLGGYFAECIFTGREPEFPYLMQTGDAEMVRIVESGRRLDFRQSSRAMAETLAVTSLTAYWDAVTEVASQIDRTSVATEYQVRSIVDRYRPKKGRKEVRNHV